jgi:hypothetical protein
VITVTFVDPLPARSDPVVLEGTTTSKSLVTFELLDGECTLVGNTLATLKSGVSLDFDGSPCTVRATSAPAAGYRPTVPKKTTVTWRPSINYATWTNAPAQATGTSFTAHLGPIGGAYPPASLSLAYNSFCSGPSSAPPDSDVTFTVLVTGGNCVVSGQASYVSFAQYSLAATLSVSIPAPPA